MRISRTFVGAAALLATVLSPTAQAAPAAVPLAEAIESLPVAQESREGYSRSAFRHWVDEDRDGCNARMEVLKRDAKVAPSQSGRCTLTGGSWHSWYDEVDIEGPRGIDIDHLVPLAEAWDSGASAWSAERREQYANDLGDERALQAVSARSNRSKADKDPTDWMPPIASATCRYVTEWTAIKLRWDLSVDENELRTLQRHAAGCSDQTVPVEKAS